MKVVKFKENSGTWNRYVLNHPKAGIYHLFEWGAFFKDFYGFEPLNLAVYDGNDMVGAASLVLMRNHLMKKILVSLPYFCCGGILTDNPEAERALLQKIKRLTVDNKFGYSLLRIENVSDESIYDHVDKQKASFVLPLDHDPDKVFSKFEKQIRRRIRKGYKSGCLIDKSKKYFDDFYEIYSINMRTLGSPAHKKSFYLEIMNRFPDNYNILVVLLKGKVIGAQFLSYFKDTVYLPLASSLKEYNKYSPSQLLYWESIKYGCENGYRFCDFGRSTVGTGPYVFKKQWNAEEVPLDYCYFYPKEVGGNAGKSDDSYGKLKIVSELWKRVPLQMTKLIGPHLAKLLP